MSATCRGCGKPIVWALDADTGGRIPLDPRPPIYNVPASARESSIPGTPIVVSRNLNAMVSHFATCPEANSFSRSKKKENA